MPVLKRPRTLRSKLLALLSALVAVAVLAFLAIYFLIFPTSSPKPFKLTSTTASTTSAGPAAASTSASASAAASAGVSGSWAISSGSQAGYRVREQLAFLPAESDAVGRTSQISGSARLAQSGADVVIRSASFTVAVKTLKSDRSMRDEKIRSIGLESDRYPTATFALAAPLTLARSALDGHVAHVSAVGELEIHGATRRVTIPLELTLSGSTLQAAGALTFPWSEFAMTAPSVGGFVTVTGKATMEFDLRLVRA
jgi:polyisoprenoid-binding protein YceI